ncbi:minor tail protein [Gordonia phage GodonK]|uniref:Minor tail protein n=1 Tax=Gordonia phage GodonK TaxID=2562192 RepID=A0A4D6E2H5_9CAUD|nr:minor tail protein [Gordonia phage GodonK]QBZ72711.1 minor tail protein [Gordonia phage GodonK]
MGTSPDMYMPPNAWTGSTISDLQDQTKENAATQANADVVDMMDDVFDALIDNLFGGFGDIVQAVVAGINDFIGDLVEIFTDVLSGVPIIGGALGDLADSLLGLKENVDSNTVVVQQTTTQIESVQQIIAVQSGIGVWESGPDPTGMVSFPFAYLATNLPSISIEGGSHGHNITGSTSAATAAGDSHTHSNGSLSASSSSHSHTATVTNSLPTINATTTYAPWASVRFSATAERKMLRYIAGKTGTVSSFYIDLYKQETDGSSTLLYSSPDQSGIVVGAMAWRELSLGYTINSNIGDVFEVQFRSSGTGSIQIAGIDFPYYAPISGYRPYAPGSARNASSTPAPSTIDTATRDAMYVGPTPFVSIGIDPGIVIPRSHYISFDNGSWANWYRFNDASGQNLRINDGRVDIPALSADGWRHAVYLLSTASDKMETIFDVLGVDNDRPAGGGICATASGLNGCLLIVNNANVRLMKMTAAGTMTTLATSTAIKGTGTYRVQYDPATNKFIGYKASGSTWTQGIEFTDSSNTITHGAAKRFGTISIYRNDFNSGGEIDNVYIRDYDDDE